MYFTPLLLYNCLFELATMCYFIVISLCSKYTQTTKLMEADFPTHPTKVATTSEYSILKGRGPSRTEQYGVWQAVGDEENPPQIEKRNPAFYIQQCTTKDFFH